MTELAYLLINFVLCLWNKKKDCEIRQYLEFSLSCKNVWFKSESYFKINLGILVLHFK